MKYRISFHIKEENHATTRAGNVGKPTYIFICLKRVSFA